MDKWALQKITFGSNSPAPAAGETVLVANFVKGNALTKTKLRDCGWLSKVIFFR